MEVAADKVRQLANAAQRALEGTKNKYFTTNKKGKVDLKM
jgi:hypothetical protein